MPLIDASGAPLGPLASLVFLSPLGALVAIAALVPLAGLALAARRVRRARKILGLATPPAARRTPKLAALVAVPALLGLAAAQPALQSRSTARLRTDAQAVFVLDISRSMRASKSPGAPTRLARAKQDAIALRAALPEIPCGVATFTDRVLPDLLPNPDQAVFDETVEQAVAIEQPPPANENVIATTLGALGALGTQNFFPASARHRLVVVLTDGESRPFDAEQVARALAAGPGAKLLLVHVSAPGESVYDGSQPEAGYHESPSSQSLETLAQAAGGTVVGEHALSAAIRSERADLGASGPTIVSGAVRKTRTLAPYVVLLSLLPTLLLLVGPRKIARVVAGSGARSRGPAGGPRRGDAPAGAEPA
jgi:hypothetical protein